MWISKSRDRKRKWLIAQERERGWWKGYLGSERQKSMRKILKARALFFENYIKMNKMELKPYVKILEIGGAGEPLVNFFSLGEKYTLDPLAEDYKNLFADLYKHNSLVRGKAESLPFLDSRFDIVVILNTLDHCENPNQALLEIWRVLKNNGVILLSLNVTSSLTALLRTVLLKPVLRPKLSDYLVHPYHFSLKEAIHLIRERFKVISIWKDCHYLVSSGRNLKNYLRKPSVLYLLGRK